MTVVFQDLNLRSERVLLRRFTSCPHLCFFMNHAPYFNRPSWALTTVVHGRVRIKKVVREIAAEMVCYEDDVKI